MGSDRWLVVRVAGGSAFGAIVDMVKGIDKSVSIEGIRLEAKTGGKSGDWHRA